MKKIASIIVFHIALTMSIFAQQIVLDEDFSDGLLNGYNSGVNGYNYHRGGGFSSGVGLHVPNSRSFGYGLSKILSQSPADAWAGAVRWGVLLDSTKSWSSNNLKSFVIDQQNDVVIIRYRSFSDVGRKPEEYHAQITLMNYNERFFGAPHYDHDISIETDNFYSVDVTQNPRQLNGNVNTIRNWAPSGIKYAHFTANGGRPTNTELSQEWTNLVVFRPKPFTAKTNVEQWGALNSADYDVDAALANRMYPNPPYDFILDTVSGFAKFNYIQFTFFSYMKNTSPFLKRTAVAEADCQIGFVNAHVGITKKCDFNLDYSINQSDADTLTKYWGIATAMMIKTGDATNDGATDLNDANPLVAFWSNPVDSGKASGTYNPTTGEVKITAQNISYLKIESKSGKLIPASINLSSLTPSASSTGNTIAGAFSTSTWTFNDKSFGIIAESSLDVNDLILTVNYKGSKVAKGFSVPFNVGYTNVVPTTVSFVKDTGWAHEGVDLNYAIELKINNMDKANNTIVRIIPIAGDTNIIRNYVSQDIVFPMGSSQNKLFYFPIINDTIEKINDSIVFGIQVVGEGNVQKGEVQKFTLYKIDDDGKLNLNKNKHASDFVVYPIPSYKSLYIDGLVKNEPYKIYNLFGELMIEGSTTKEVNIETLKAGLYILNIAGNNFKFVKK